MIFIIMKRTTEEFKKELSDIQPELIVLGEYVNIDTKILITDELGIKYLANPSILLHGHKPSIKIALDKTDAFIKKAKKIHGDKFLYFKTEYKDSYVKTKIACPIHGFFLISPSKHLDGQSCAKCSLINKGENSRDNTEEFIKKAVKKHNGVYNYSLVDYVTAIKKIKIICPIHGVFEQQPNNHLTGQGCNKCGNDKVSKAAKINSYGWSFSKWKDRILKNGNKQPILYVIKCFNESENFIKIGITMHSVKIRYAGKKDMPYNYETLLELSSTPENVFNCELIIKKHLKKLKHIPSLKFNGMTECYDSVYERDILEFSNKQFMNINENCSIK